MPDFNLGALPPPKGPFNPPDPPFDIAERDRLFNEIQDLVAKNDPTLAPQIADLERKLDKLLEQ